MNMKKKAIVLLYSPRELAEFTWFYCKYGRDYEWTAVCAPYGNAIDYVANVCKDSKLFVEVLEDKRCFDSMPFVEKIILFLKMCFYFLIGKRRRFCKRIIEECLGNRKYDLVVIPCDFGILPGAFLACSNECETIIMEDGAADYKTRYRWVQLKDIKSVYDVIGCMLARMGYANPSIVYTMEDTKNCIKYSTEPERMMYRDYKEIRKMPRVDYIKDEEYNNIINRAYSLKDENYIGEILLLTSPVRVYVGDNLEYVEKIQDFVNSNYKGKTILMKRHPRDDAKYKFLDEIKVIELDQNLPFEIIANRINVNTIYSVFASSTILSLRDKIEDIKVFYFNCIEKQSDNKNTQYNYKKNFEDSIEVCHIDRDDIIILE